MNMQGDRHLFTDFTVYYSFSSQRSTQKERAIELDGIDYTTYSTYRDDKAPTLNQELRKIHVNTQHSKEEDPIRHLKRGSLH